MPGFYLHIPFCKQRCIYCDFVSSTSLELKENVVEAMVKEIENVEITNFSGNTIYFGGGTPSLLSVSQIERLLTTIQNSVSTNFLEITIELNPDDITLNYLQNLRKIGINRVSIGIQSFIDNELRFLNRRHTAKQALEAVEIAYTANFKKISVDLMYGLPNSSTDCFRQNLSLLFSLPVNHFSAYHLSLEEGTLLYKEYISGKLSLPMEEESVTQFELLRKLATEEGFLHYETSNFARPGEFGVHNSNYWKNFPYIGIGVGAHGFDGDKQRTQNPNEITDYLEMINQQQHHHRKLDTLTNLDKANEQLLIGLRTMWGVNLEQMKPLLSDIQYEQFYTKLQSYILQERMTIKHNNIIIPHKYWFIADNIIQNLIIG